MMSNANPDVLEGLKLPASLLQQLYASGLLRDVCDVTTKQDSAIVSISLATGTWLLCACLEESGWLMVGSALL